MMPKHLTFVEAYFGSGAVLLAKDPKGISEVINDLDGRVANFFGVVNDPEFFPAFLRGGQVPFSEELWRAAHGHVYGHDRVADAVAFVSAGGLGLVCRAGGDIPRRARVGP